MNASTAFPLVKTIQSNALARAHASIERTVVVGRRDANHRRLHGFGAGRFESFDQTRAPVRADG